MKAFLSSATVAPDGNFANAGNLAAGQTSEQSIGLPSNAQACPLCRAPEIATVLAENRRALNRCLRCGVMYLHPHPAPDQLREFFSSKYIACEQDVELRFGTRPCKLHQAVAAFIQQRKTQGSILDVGCAGGHFLDGFFRGCGWNKWGVELSRFAAERAARKSIRVHVGDLHSAALPRHSFDVITLLDTFYYFLQPQRELAVIRQSLKTEGLLVIVLPSAAVHIWRNTAWRALLFRPGLFRGTRESLLDTHHLYFYSPQSLRHLLRQCGFDPIAVRPLPAVGQRSWWINRLADGYYTASAAAWKLHLSEEMLAPHFLVAAHPA